MRENLINTLEQLDFDNFMHHNLPDLFDIESFCETLKDVGKSSLTKTLLTHQGWFHHSKSELLPILKHCNKLLNEARRSYEIASLREECHDARKMI